MLPTEACRQKKKNFRLTLDENRNHASTSKNQRVNLPSQIGTQKSNEIANVP
jgi:hypothetical protein